MVVHLGETEVLERQALELQQRRFHVDRAGAHRMEQRAQPFGIHARRCKSGGSTA
jgi:hypothetical protein